MPEKPITSEKKQIPPDEIRKRIDRLNRMAETLLADDPIQAQEYCKQAVELASQLPADEPHLSGLAASRFLMGRMLADKGDHHQSTLLLLEALSAYEKLAEEVQAARVLNAVGLNYCLLGAYPESLQQLLRAQHIFQQRNMAAQEAEVLNNLGLLHLHLDDPAKASKILAAGYEIAKKTVNQRLQAQLLNRMSKAACALKDFTRAIEYGLKSIESYQQMQNHTGEIEALNSVGDAYLARNDAERALAFFQLVTGAAERFNNPVELARAHRKIGIVSLNMDQYDDAIHSVNQALKILQDTGERKQVFRCHQTLASIYKKAGNFQKSLEHFELFYNLKEEIFNEEADTRLKTLEIAHQLETTRKDAELYRLINVELKKEIEERKKAEIALQEMAVTDPLTGLYNRRYFFTLAAREAERSNRYGHSLSAIILDLDNFKQVNDTLGHITGDHVLVNIASHIRDEIRKVDFAGRFGGDEFVILLPETEPSRARLVAERLRRRILHHPEVTERGRVLATISLGVSGTTGDKAENIETLIDQADQALYQAKLQGRNRVVLFGTPPHTTPFKSALLEESAQNEISPE